MYLDRVFEHARMNLDPAVRAEIRARARAAVLGAFVADAASMPLHWIYDSNHLNSLVGNQDPAFFSPPSCPFYQVSAGHLALQTECGNRFGIVCVFGD